jgi:hypothetical protein
MKFINYTLTFLFYFYFFINPYLSVLKKRVECTLKLRIFKYVPVAQRGEATRNCVCVFLFVFFFYVGTLIQMIPKFNFYLSFMLFRLTVPKFVPGLTTTLTCMAAKLQIHYKCVCLSFFFRILRSLTQNRIKSEFSSIFLLAGQDQPINEKRKDGKSKSSKAILLAKPPPSDLPSFLPFPITA